MIELIFAIFLISEKLVFLDKPMPPTLCLELNVLASHVDERELFRMAKTKWRGNEPRLEDFHTFWENRDTCTISD